LRWTGAPAELGKRGKHIKLRDQPLQVLTALLEHPGEVMSKKLPIRSIPIRNLFTFRILLVPNEPVYRLWIDSRRIERAASFETFLAGAVPRCGFQGLAPDGALLVTLQRNHADIYALSLDLP